MGWLPAQVPQRCHEFRMNRSATMTEAAVPSPCTGVCRIGVREHCVGCGRVMDEIIDWSRASRARQLVIREQAAARLAMDEPAPR